MSFVQRGFNILLMFAAFCCYPALALSAEETVIPFTGKIENITVGAVSSRYYSSGEGYLEIKVKNSGNNEVKTFALNRWNSSTQDNSAFMAIYDVAMYAYTNNKNVTITDYECLGDCGTYVGFVISISQ